LGARHLPAEAARHPRLLSGIRTALAAIRRCLPSSTPTRSPDWDDAIADLEHELPGN